MLSDITCITNRASVYWLPFTWLGGQEADQEGGHILSQGVGDDPKVQDGEDLIPEREVEGQGAHQKPGTIINIGWKDRF